jgi:hypothetical protein
MLIHKLVVQVVYGLIRLFKHYHYLSTVAIYLRIYLFVCILVSFVLCICMSYWSHACPLCHPNVV